MTTTRLLCIWLPNWPIQRLSAQRKAAQPQRAAQPPSKNRPDPSAAPAIGPAGPIVLWAHDPRRGRLVVACCAAAQGCGVRLAMPCGEARSLLEKLARRAAAERPLVAEHQPQADLRALHQLAQAALLELGPIVALEPLEPRPWAGQPLHQPQSLLLDVTGLGPLMGDEESLARRALQMVARHGLAARVAIAHCPGAAWAVAHFGIGIGIGTGTGDSGWLVVRPGDEGPALWRLPVAALRVPIEPAQTLHRLGIETIGDLLRLPRDGLATRLGDPLLKRLDQALGTIDEPLSIYHPPADDRVQTDLEYATSDRRILSHRIAGLIRQLQAGLAIRQRGALRLSCRLEIEAQPPLDLQLGLFQPTADVDHLTRLLLGSLENRTLPGPVHRVILTATLTGPLAQRQGDLGFGACPGGPLQANQLARLVDAIGGRLGQDRVLGVSLSENRLPEQSYRLRPLGGMRDMSGRGRGIRGRRPASASAAVGQQDSLARPATAPAMTAPSPHDPLRRPIELLAEPIPIDVLQLSPQGVPLRIQLRGCSQNRRVVRHWGPERIETGWWQGPSVRRDYFRIEIDTGQWLWIYRPLSGSDWMLHGWFG